ncbi:MAG: hypothetical protein RIF41_20030 [Polyangiaceae bacterium]
MALTTETTKQDALSVVLSGGHARWPPELSELALNAAPFPVHFMSI